MARRSPKRLGPDSTTLMVSTFSPLRRTHLPSLKAFCVHLLHPGRLYSLSYKATRKFDGFDSEISNQPSQIKSPASPFLLPPASITLLSSLHSSSGHRTSRTCISSPPPRRTSPQLACRSICSLGTIDPSRCFQQRPRTRPLGERPNAGLTPVHRSPQFLNRRPRRCARCCRYQAPDLWLSRPSQPSVLAAEPGRLRSVHPAVPAVLVKQTTGAEGSQFTKHAHNRQRSQAGVSGAPISERRKDGQARVTHKHTRPLTPPRTHLSRWRPGSSL